MRQNPPGKISLAGAFALGYAALGMAQREGDTPEWYDELGPLDALFLGTVWPQRFRDGYEFANARTAWFRRSGETSGVTRVNLTDVGQVRAAPCAGGAYRSLVSYGTTSSGTKDHSGFGTIDTPRSLLRTYSTAAAHRHRCPSRRPNGSHLAGLDHRTDDDDA